MRSINGKIYESPESRATQWGRVIDRKPEVHWLHAFRSSRQREVQ
jgi:hypothetical protein